MARDPLGGRRRRGGEAPRPPRRGGRRRRVADRRAPPRGGPGPFGPPLAGRAPNFYFVRMARKGGPKGHKLGNTRVGRAREAHSALSPYLVPDMT